YRDRGNHDLAVRGPRFSAAGTEGDDRQGSAASQEVLKDAVGIPTRVEPQRIFIAELDDIGQASQLLNLLDRIGPIFHQRRAQIRIKAQNLSCWRRLEGFMDSSGTWTLERGNRTGVEQFSLSRSHILQFAVQLELVVGITGF